MDEPYMYLYREFHFSAGHNEMTFEKYARIIWPFWVAVLELYADSVSLRLAVEILDMAITSS